MYNINPRLNSDGLKAFYLSNIRSKLSYAAPAWYSLLGEHNRDRLVRIQRAALKIILPNLENDQRLSVLGIPKLCEFPFDISYSHLLRMVNNESHPLYSELLFNTNSRTSSLAIQIFRPKLCRIERRRKGFFNFFMTYHDNGLVYKIINTSLVCFFFTMPYHSSHSVPSVMIIE